MITLAAAALVFALASGALGALLYRADHEARTLAAREATEDRRQGDLLGETEDDFQAAKERTADAQHAVRVAEDRAMAAQAIVAELEWQGARYGAGSASVQERYFASIFAWFPEDTSRAEADDIVAAGRATCAHFDALGTEDAHVMSAIEKAADAGFDYDQAGAIVGGAVYAFCPEHADALI